MIKSETLSLGACAEFSFPFGLKTSFNLLLLGSLRLPYPFAMLNGAADRGNFKALSKLIALSDFVEYDNNPPIIFLFTCNDNNAPKIFLFTCEVLIVLFNNNRL